MYCIILLRIKTIRTGNFLWHIDDFLVITIINHLSSIDLNIYSMVRRKRDRLEYTAFSPPFDQRTHEHNIPQKYEDILLDGYTNFCEIKNTDDIKLDNLAEAIEKYIGVPFKLIPDKNELRSWCIDNTEIVDFEKWLYNGYLWLKIVENMDIADDYWKMILKLLNGGSEKSNGNENELDDNDRFKKLYLNDVKKLVKIGRIDADIIGMLQTASRGKVFINYIDFVVLLGRLGEFN